MNITIDPVKDAILLMAASILDGERGESTMKRSMVAAAVVLGREGDKLKEMRPLQWKHLLCDELKTNYPGNMTWWQYVKFRVTVLWPAYFKVAWRATKKDLLR